MKSSAHSKISGCAKSFDGVDIYYEFYGKKGPTLAFVHGWMCDRTYWQNQIEYFTKSHCVVTLDLGGHGKSSSGRKNWTMTSFGEDIRAILEKLELQKVILIGHSMGAPVIVEAAQLIPERIMALVPVDFYNDVDDRMTEKEVVEYMEQVRLDFRNWTKTAVRRWVPQNADPRLVEWIAEDMSSGPTEIGISAMENARRNIDSLALSKVKLPIHIINSDFWLTKLEVAQKYNSDLKLSILPGAGHFLFLEKPNEFNRLLHQVIMDLS